MAITRLNPNTIFLGGDVTRVNDIAAKASITPGHLIERIATGSVFQWQKNTNTVAGKGSDLAVALDHPMANKGVDDVYNAGDLVEAGIMHSGSSAWMLIASGQNIVYGNSLESAGDGTLRIYSSGAVLFIALESKPNVVVQTRIRVEAV